MFTVRHAALSAASLAVLLTLGACKKEGVVAKDESVESVAQKVAAADIKPQPGRWESQVKMERMDMEGMPQQVKDAMAKQLASGRTFSSCLTPEQVNKPNGGFFAGGGPECKYKTFAMTGGKLDAEMTCGDQGMTQDMSLTGTYGETEYNVTVNTKTQGPAGKPMTMVVNVASRRTGECDGKEDITAEDVKKMEEYAKSLEAKAK